MYIFLAKKTLRQWKYDEKHDAISKMQKKLINSEGRKFADLQIGGVFGDFHPEGVSLGFFHPIISHPKISRENWFS